MVDIDYQIEFATTMADITYQVKQRISEGWLPQGGICYVYSPPLNLWAQALIMKTEKPAVEVAPIITKITSMKGS
jgi:hypothetical protein